MARDHRPLDLPLVRTLESFNFELDGLRASLRTEKLLGWRANPNGGFRDPAVGQLLGPLLAQRVGALMSRPICVFANSFMWFYENGSVLNEHTDRWPLDITMSIPVVLDGQDAWPLAVRQPKGEVIEYASPLGSVCIIDGRWRRHWRARFTGERAVMLLLHWQAPAVLWPRMLDAEERRRLTARGASAVTGDVLERCADLARLAVPPSDAPRMSLCDGSLRSITPCRATRNDARFLVALDGELSVAFDAGEPVSLTPGDGIAFAAKEACTLDWGAAEDRGLALQGHAPGRFERFVRSEHIHEIQR